MALFETMRENTKVVLWITVIAFVGLIFLAWGADFSSRGRGGGPGEAGVIGKVNGQRISWNEYQNATQQAWMTYEQQTGKRPDQAAEVRIQAQVWDNLVTQALIRQETQRHNITATDREVAIALANNPPMHLQANPAFITDGQFDIQKYQAWIADPRTNTLPLERELRDLVATEKLRLLLFAQIKVSDEEVREAWRQENQTCSFEYAAVPFSQLLRGSPEVADADLQAYLEAHPDRFRKDEQLALEYVRLPKRLSQTDSLEARVEIEEALGELQRGEDFETIVLMYSEAPPNRRGGESATFLTRGQIDQPEVAEAAFSQPVGEPGPLLTSRDGFHIVQVDARETQDGQEKVKLSEVFVPLRMSMDTNISYRDRMTDLADSAAVTSFVDAAEAAGLAIDGTSPFERDAFVPGLMRVSAASEFAKTAEAGEISKPIETIDSWYLLHVVEVIPAQVPPFEEVRAQVRTRYLAQQRKEQAEALARAILEQAQAGTPLEDAAAGDTLAVFASADSVKLTGFVSGLGTAPQVTGAAFAQGEGLVPFVVTTGTHAVVVDVESVSAFDEVAFAEQRERTEDLLMRQKQNKAITDWLEELRAEAKIEDYRFSVASL